MNLRTDLLRYAADFPEDAILRDYTDSESGLRILVVRGPQSFCGYVGVKADHALAGLTELRFHCHHGITWQNWGLEGSIWEPGWYWWGWDYFHFTDFVDWEGILPAGVPPEAAKLLSQLQARRAAFGRPLKNWTVDEVMKDALAVLAELKQALLESEKYAALVLAR